MLLFKLGFDNAEVAINIGVKGGVEFKEVRIFKEVKAIVVVYYIMMINGYYIIKNGYNFFKFQLLFYIVPLEILVVEHVKSAIRHEHLRYADAFRGLVVLDDGSHDAEPSAPVRQG